MIDEVAKLSEHETIQQLDMQGNPISELDGYREKVFEMIDCLQILDGQDKEGNDIASEEDNEMEDLDRDNQGDDEKNEDEDDDESHASDDDEESDPGSEGADDEEEEDEDEEETEEGGKILGKRKATSVEDDEPTQESSSKKQKSVEST